MTNSAGTFINNKCVVTKMVLTKAVDLLNDVWKFTPQERYWDIKVQESIFFSLKLTKIRELSNAQVVQNYSINLQNMSGVADNILFFSFFFF